MAQSFIQETLKYITNNANAIVLFLSNDGINKKKSVIGIIDIIPSICNYFVINLFNRHKQIQFIL